MHARYYNHWIGRFLSPDPVRGQSANPQNWNLYGYGLNNPVRFFDPTGFGPEGTEEDPFTDYLLVIGAYPGGGGSGGGGRGEDRRGRRPGDWRLQRICWPVSTGISIDLSTINPFTSGGGGVRGLNLQFVPGEGLGLYEVRRREGARTAGLDIGFAFLTGNVAIGSGPWAGDFLQGMASYEGATAGAFGSTSGAFPGLGPGAPGWYGIQGGGTLGPPGLGGTVTTYQPLRHFGLRNLLCRSVQ
ncbi:MAG: hypothetical protein L0191_16895, partial [Acidobacteria bacterium]|nr:hypothetical protein [Acidobacteriota bacterium]